MNDTRGTYWIIGSVGRCGTPPAPKPAYERVIKAMEAEENVEREEDRRRNQQDDDAKGRDESTSWLKQAFNSWMWIAYAVPVLTLDNYW